MKIRTIFSQNQFLGHYPSWWRYKVCEYKYLLGQGEFFLGEIESLITTGGAGAILILLIEKYTTWLPPWYYAPLIVLFLRIVKIIMGQVDRKYLKFGQAQQEFSLRANLTPAGTETMD